jgi:hypothetical protein
MASTPIHSYKGFLKTKLILTGLIPILIACVFVFYSKHHHETRKQILINQGVATADQNVPGKDNADSNTEVGSPGADNASKDKANNTPGSTLDSNIQPSKPVGDFVSNHRPQLNSTNIETSICTTTPGALCQISFTSGSVTKSLPAKKTNANGSVGWDSWTLQSVGITKGTWRINAVASNGSKTAITQDAIDLVVVP